MLVTLDFETYFDTKVSLTKMTTMEYIKHPMFKVWGVGIKIDNGPTEWFGEDEVEDVIDDIDWEKAHLLCHNTSFDGYILTQLYDVRPLYYLDTAAMSRGWWPGEPASLKEAAIRCFPADETMRKGEELVTAKGTYDLPPAIEDVIADYCIQDVDLTYAIYQQLLPDYPQKELDLIDLTCRMFCEPRLHVNTDKLETFVEQVQAESKEAIDNSGLERAVLASNKQFAEWATEQGLKVPVKKSPTTGKMIPALGKNDAGFRQWQDQNPEYAHVFTAREAVKSRLNETRAQRFINCAGACGGKLPSPLRYYAAHTGRFGGTDKINLQNLPRGSQLRTALEAPPGHYLYVADLSQIEARVLAWLADQNDLLGYYWSGVDVYCEFASKVFDREITKADTIERFIGKTAVLGLGYGMGPEKFQATLKQSVERIEIDFDKALSVVRQYRSDFAYIPKLWVALENMLRQSRTMRSDDGFGISHKCVQATHNAIQLPNGMALKYPCLQMTPDGLAYKSMNKLVKTYGGRITENVVQALARIIICDQMLAIQALDGFNVVLTVHDEIIAVADQSNPEEKLQTMIDVMRTPPAWASELPLEAEGGWDIGYSK